MSGAACPDCTRRIQASSPVLRSARAAGVVRVAAFPSWWQPTHDWFFIVVSQSLCVMPFGILVWPPNWLASGIFIIEYQ
jgi:hypothetical protein